MSRRGNSVTLFVDASFCRRTKASGWGAWAKRDGGWGRIFGGGFSTPITQPHEAELLGIANAMTILENRAWLDGAVTLMVQSDCLHALCCIARNVPKAAAAPVKDGAAVKPHRRAARPGSADEKATSHINAIVHRTGARILLRHVRGHRSGPDRQWVNRQCDSEAKRHMRAERIRAQKATPAPDPMDHQQ